MDDNDASRSPEAASADTDGRLVLDLGNALCDGYLRRIVLGPGGEPCEVGIHRLRLVRPPEGDASHAPIGLRLRGVGTLAGHAARRKPEGDEWIDAKEDWIRDLTTGDLVPPVITGALMGAEDSLLRLRRHLEELSWYAGAPEDAEAFCRAAPVFLELTAEGRLASGEDGRMRLFAGAMRLEIRDHAGLTTLEAVLAAGEEYLEAWRSYRRARETDPAYPEDLQFEWLLEA